MPRTPLIPRIAAIALALAAGAHAAADTILVPQDFPLPVALAVAQNGDEIVISPIGSPYLIAPGLVIDNKQLTIRGSTGNPEDVVIDAVGLDIALQITGAGSSGTVIEDLTIRNGRGPTAANSSGAGVRAVQAGNITLRNCIIRDNVQPASDGKGAGVYGTQTSFTIERCAFINNTLQSNIGDGGGIFFNGGTHRITDSTFTGNGVAPSIDVNSPGSLGGAFYADGGSSVTITRCTFENNRAGRGGGIFVHGSNIATTIDESVLRDNAALQGGGLFASGASGNNTPRVRNSLFIGNTSLSDGAAIFTHKPTFLTNLTIVNNTAGTGGIIIGSSLAGSLAVDNCILWGNTYSGANGLLLPGSTALVRHCILQEAYTGAAGSGSNQVIDPGFADASNGNFRLAPDSPAIDAGNTNLYSGPFADLDGNPRVVDNPDVPNTGFTLSGPVIDIGAYEFQVFTPNPCPADLAPPFGVLDIFDVLEFLTLFEQGCP